MDRFRPRFVYASVFEFMNEDLLVAAVVLPGMLIVQPILLPWLAIDEAVTALLRTLRRSAETKEGGAS